MRDAEASSISARGVGGARGRERAGPTRSHPEPGRDPAQRRRVLWGRPHGRRGRRGHPPPPESGVGVRVQTSKTERRSQSPIARRGVEQRQLVGLITQRSGVRIPPPLPQENAIELDSIAFLFYPAGLTIRTNLAAVRLLAAVRRRDRYGRRSAEKTRRTRPGSRRARESAPPPHAVA